MVVPEPSSKGLPVTDEGGMTPEPSVHYTKHMADSAEPSTHAFKTAPGSQEMSTGVPAAKVRVGRGWQAAHRRACRALRQAPPVPLRRHALLAHASPVPPHHPLPPTLHVQTVSDA